jgi:curved DNA-binding protein CbpA
VTYWKDYYAILKLPQGCEDNERIRNNYKSLIRLVHPDANPELGSQESKDLNEAYDVLSDASRRTTYWQYYQTHAQQPRTDGNSEELRRERDEARRRAERAEHEQLAKEAERKKRLRVCALIILIAVVVCGGGIAAITFSEPIGYYRKGEESFAAGEYDTAEHYFNAAGSYKDAKKRRVQARGLILNGINEKKLADAGYELTGSLLTFGGRKWRVLAFYEYYILIIADEIVTMMPYNDGTANLDGVDFWGNSSVRAYLNDVFYNEFSAEEKSRIKSSYRTGGYTSEDGVKIPELDVADYIFLLSENEASRYIVDRFAVMDTALIEAGIYDGEPVPAMAAAYHCQPSKWWLSDPGEEASTAMYVNENGYFLWESGNTVTELGVRPAMFLSLE